MSEPITTPPFSAQLLNIFTGALLTKLVDIGYQTGLFEASLAGPASSEGLAERAGQKERYVREWLGAMVSGGIYRYDPANQQYSLPAEHAPWLTGNGAQNLCPNSRMINHFGGHLQSLVRCFSDGGGINYSAYRPVFTQCMDDSWRRIYDAHLINGFIGAVPGLTDQLRSGIKVMDIGCGSGHAMNILAREFPHSQFVGHDIGVDAIAAAQAEASAMGVSNSRFEVVDVSQAEGESGFDLITAFDAIHDQRSPQDVLNAVSQRLKPGGIFLMIEFKFSSQLEENIGNPFAAMYYSISLMHCMPVSLAVGGAGLGTVWGEQTARRLLGQAGLHDVQVLDSPRPQNCIFVCRHGVSG